MSANDRSYTPDEFCEAERMSRSKLYQMWSHGKGPRWFQIGNRRRISHEARIEWRRKLEAEADAMTASSNNSHHAEAR